MFILCVLLLCLCLQLAHTADMQRACSVNATVEVGIFNQTSNYVQNFNLAPGDIGFARKGQGHYIKETAVCLLA